MKKLQNGLWLSLTAILQMYFVFRIYQYTLPFSNTAKQSTKLIVAGTAMYTYVQFY